VEETTKRRRFLNIFPIGFHVKTMSTDGGHLGWSFGSLDIILKVDHLRTIHAMTSKIVFNDPDLGSKWPPSADIVLT
jgi:hypothetical protein